MKNVKQNIDGKPKEVFDVLETKDGSFVKDGGYKTWYPGEQPESEGKYSEGKKTGDWKSWYNNGQMKTDVTYKLDTLDGHYLHWYENGQKKIAAQTASGKFVGHFVSWFENGQMQADATYNRKGKNIGPFNEWYENGQMKWKTNLDNKGNKTGVHTLWHSNGQKEAEWNYENNLLNGSMKCWNSNGRVIVSREFKDSVDINFPATYKRSSGDRLDLMKDQTYKLTYLEQSFFSRGWKTVQGKFQITLNESGARLDLSNFGQSDLVKFNKDSIVYKNTFGTNIIFIRSNSQ